MPFANKFRAMLDMPLVGDTVEGYLVESVAVGHEGKGPGLYGYAVRIVLQGPGGQEGVRRALKVLFAAHPLTFSGYGNPYQLWFGKPELESLGEQRYAVTAEGAGARVFLEPELERFLAYLAAHGQLAAGGASVGKETLVQAYLAEYQAEIARKVARYRSALRRAGEAGTESSPGA
jgi:hypothetical protein